MASQTRKFFPTLGQAFVFATMMAPASLLWAQDYVPGQVIVKFRSLNGKPQAGAKSFHSKMSQKGALLKSYSKLGISHYKLNPEQNLNDVIQELKADESVEYVEPNYILRKATIDAFSDDRSSNESAMSLEDVQALGGVSSQGNFSQNYAPVKVTESWSAISASSLIKPIVAVVDTGVDYNHSVFSGSSAIWTNPGESGLDSQGANKATNGVDDDTNGYVDDVRGWNFVAGSNNPMDDDSHGTHVAGIILGVSQDIFATTLSPAKLKIMPLKFLGADGSGSTSDAINAIYYAVNNGANVINNSWGGSTYSQSLHDALTFAYNNRATLVAAAGNYTSNNDSTGMYPANYPIPSQISVAATNDYDSIASFSNYGKNSVHVSAPGVGIMSTVPGNSFRYLSGTSMAAPFVAGMAAMVYREASNLTGYQIKNVILATVTPVSSLSLKVFTSGRVNEYNAVVEAKNEINVQAILPSYVASAPAGTRAPAMATTGGCGTISSLVYAQGGATGGLSPLGGLMLGLLMALPMMVYLVFRLKSQAPTYEVQRRQHERFVMNSDIKVKVGDRELQGHMKTISEGGLSFDADSMLEKGGVLTLTITSPDGREQIQVQGQVVWSEQNQSYGVKFAESKDGAMSVIRGWTAGLLKAG